VVARPAPRALVAGVGEPMRQDDGCGPRVVRALRGRLASDVAAVDRVAELTELLDRWTGVPLAIVVDAMRSGAPAGTLRRLEGEALLQAAPDRLTSSHGLSIRDAYELGRALGQLPGRLVVYLIEAGEIGHGERLSADVEGAVDRAANAVLAELADVPPVSAGGP